MIKLSVKSLDSKSILLYKAFIVRFLLQLNVSFNVINVPRRKFRVTLLKSPHVNKKSREQFQFTSYKIVFYIMSDLNASNLKYIVLNKPKVVQVSLFKS